LGRMGRLVKIERVKRSRAPLRLHGTIARDLGIGIVSGLYQPGDILSGEVASSERLAVSRTAYREAVRILAAKGLVESRPKIGTKVSSREHWQLLDPDVLAWTFDSEPDLELLNSLSELRDIIESEAAALAAVRRTEAQLKVMRQALERMARFTIAIEAGREADQEFHATLLRATGNPYFISLTTGVNAAVNTTNMFKQRDRPLERDPVPDHMRVLEAIAAKDAAKAKRRMSELIRLARADTPTPRMKRAKKRA